MIKRQKLKVALVAIMTVIMSLANITAVLAAGSDTCSGMSWSNDRAVESGSPANKYKGDVTPIFDDGVRDILVAPAGYANKIGSTSKAKSSTEGGSFITTSAYYKFEASNGTSTADIRYLGKQPDSEDEDFYYFDLGKNNNGDKPTITYTGYTFLDANHKTRNIKVEATVNWYSYKKKESYYFDGYGNRPAVLAIGKILRGGFPRVDMINIGDIRIDYKFYDADTGEPIKIKSNTSWYDIDDGQAMSFKANTIDGVAVTKDCKLMYRKDDDWHVFCSNYTDDSEDVFDWEAPYAAEMLYNSNHFNIIYTSGQHDKDGNITYGTPSGGRSAFTPSQYALIITPPSDPYKAAYDKDDVKRSGDKLVEGKEELDTDNPSNSVENTIEKKSKTWAYRITQPVPDGMNTDSSLGPKFTKFVIEDTLDKCIQPKDGNTSTIVIKNTHGDDLTDDFNITYENDKITATAKASAMNSMSKMYGSANKIHMIFTAEVKDDVTLQDLANHQHLDGKMFIQIKNNAKTTMEMSHTTRTFTGETNDTITNIPVPKPKKSTPTKRVSDGDELAVTYKDDNMPLSEKGEAAADSNVASLEGTGKEETVTRNILDNRNRYDTFNIYHRINDGYVENWYFKKYEITDTVPDLLKIDPERTGLYEQTWTRNDAGEYQYGEWTEITDSGKFDIEYSNDNRTITAKAKADTIGDAEFYNHKRYRLKFGTQIDKEKYNTEEKVKEWIDKNYGGRVLTFRNKATVNVEDNEYYGYEGDDEEFNKPKWSKDTNHTTTHIQIPKPNKNDPVKQVTDQDNKTFDGTGAEVRVNENTLEIADETYTYHVRHRLGSGDNTIWGTGSDWNDVAYASYWFFKSYKISDKVEDLLLIQDGAKVYEYTWNKDNPNSTSDEKDVTHKFNISVSADKKSITATAKPEELTKEDFYNVKLYELRFDAKIDTEKYKYESSLKKWAVPNSKGSDSILIKWPNKATVDITDNPDPQYPDRENGKDTWKKDTNTVHTNVWIPTPGGVPEDPNDPRDPDDPKKPGISIVKSTTPYEFKVGDTIPYTITITQNNKDAVAYLVEAEDTDLPEGFIVDKDSVKAEGGTEPKAWFEGENTLKITAKYLKYGEKLVVKFNGYASKEFNGKVVPNEVIGRAWGTHEEDKSTWDRDHTSVYINSPKLNITKTVDKEKDADGKTTYKTGDPILFTSVITNKNPGTFMRNIYAVDTSETKGLRLDKKSITVKYNSRTGAERLVTLKEGRDYEVETYKAGEKIPLDNLGSKLGSQDIEDYEIATATDEENKAAETEKGTGAVLPTKNEGGFIIKFLGRYRNLGYEDKTIPATEDERGKVVKYLADSLKAVEEENGINYTTDYANLNLQNKLVISYNMIVEDENVGGRLDNFIRVPATENTNNDMIADDDKIPSGGDYARSETGSKKPVLKHEKDVAEDSTEKGGLLHYTLTSENSSQENAYDVVITDGFTTGNAVMNKDVKVMLNNSDITDSCTIEYVNAENEDEQPIGFKVTLNREFKPGEKVIIKYTATTTSENPNHVHNETVLTAKDLDSIKDEEDVPMTIKSSPTPFTVKGQKLDYVIDYTNDSGDDWDKAVVEDEIISKNASYNKDFVVTIDGKDVTEGCKIDYSKDGYKATIDTNKPLNKGQNLKVVYSTTAADAKQVDNKPVLIDPIGNHKIEGNVVKIPPAPKHVKSVKENQHDGPKGQINELHYTLNSKNDTNSTLKNVVITDEILTNNLVYNKDVKIALNGKDVTDKVKITYVKAGDKSDIGSADFKDSKNPRFIIETGMNLAKGDEFVTTYSGKVTDKNVVHNETVLKADDFDGIKDETWTPGPENGDKVTVYKDSVPKSGSVVKEGDIITYKLTAKNTGAKTSGYTHIRDVIPTGSKFVSVQNNGAYVKDGNYVEWVVKGIKPGKSVTVTFKVKVVKNPPLEIWNVATYKNTDKDPGEPGKIPTAPNKRTNETVHYTDKNHPKHPLLRAVKSSEPVSGTKVKIGDTIKYTIELENYGDKDTKTAGIRDYIPKGTTFVSAANNGKYNSKKNCVDWTNLSVKAKSKIKVSFTVKVGKNVKSVVENQALYQNDWKDTNIDPSSSTNIVEHPVGNGNPIKHVKSVKEKTTSKNAVLNYTLTTKLVGTANNIIVTDEVKSKNFTYNKASVKVFFNGKDVTKQAKISFKTYSFEIKTGINGKAGDVIKITYNGKATDGKKVVNVSTARADGVKPIVSKKTVPPKSAPPVKSTPNSPGAKTGDNTPWWIFGIMAILAAIAGFVVYKKRQTKIDVSDLF